MKKILFIASDFPIPPKGGGTRSFHFLKNLAEHNEIYLFSLWSGDINKLIAIVNIKAENIYVPTTKVNEIKSSAQNIFQKSLILAFPEFLKGNIISEYIERIIRISSQNTGIKKRLYIFVKYRLYIAFFIKLKLKSILPSKIYERYAQFNNLKNDIEKKIKDVEVVWIEFSYILPLLKTILIKYPNKKIICNTHNVEYSLEKQKAEKENNYAIKTWLDIQSKFLMNTEIKGLSTCSSIITCSETDKYILERDIRGANIHILPNGVDLDYFKTDNVYFTPKRILFTGNMDYLPNKEAVTFFTQKVLPKLVVVDKSFKFVIAGFNADKHFGYLKQNKHTELINSPADMRPVFNSAEIVVVPLFSGSGTRLKILEAFAMKKPVVSTIKGSEGINIQPGKNILMANTVNEFVEQILMLSEKNKLKQQITHEAYNLVKEQYSWKYITMKANDLIK